ncbi:ferric reductase like transmembrane component-domain-containing protein [Mycena crocata]|nr:ferric reductase like transmembrane component-domain-containing protein [Mycena crocata]
MSTSTTTAAGTAGSAPVAAGPTQFEGGMLVFHTVIVLLALVALVVLLRIPRAFARLWNCSEWRRGHLLGYEPFTWSRRPVLRGSVPKKPITLPELKEADSVDWSLSDDSHYEFKRMDIHLSQPQPRYPPALKPTPSFLRPMVSILRSRVSPGVSAIQVIVCAVYLGILVYPSVYMTTGPFVDYNRFGFISVSQVPFLVALGTKNNVLGVLLGKGYEKLNFLHRFAGILAIATANIHGVGYVYKWCIKAVFMDRIIQPSNYFGLGALLAFDILLLTSTAYIRRNAYNFFLFSHIIFFTAAIVFCMFHEPELVPYIQATGIIYALDRLLRIAKTRITTATIRPIPELGVTRIEFPYINKGWRAGQHVRIQILSSAMGIVSWAQVHPFTIASESHGEQGLVLLCKKRGAWTHDLFAAAASHGWGKGVGMNVKIAVEGPYGGPGFTMFNSYSAAVFVAGGTGITFALSAIQELIQHDMKGESRVRVIKLIWVVPDAGTWVPLIPQFIAMIQQTTTTYLSIFVHYTKAVLGNMPINKGGHPGLTLNPGRPRLIDAMESTILRAINGARDRCGLIVGVCGPVGLADDVSRAVGLVDPVRLEQIGGIEIHDEAFDW